MIERQYLDAAAVNQDEIRTSALSSLLDLVDDQALLILQVGSLHMPYKAIVLHVGLFLGPYSGPIFDY